MVKCKKDRAMTPGERILSAMQAKGISRVDLARILGSRGRVSDLLNDKREPTLREIKMLREILGISADDLIGSIQVESHTEEVDWTKFPLVEMAKRKWILPCARKKDQAKERIQSLAERVGLHTGVTSEVAFRQNVTGSKCSDPYAVQAWIMGVRLAALSQSVVANYRPLKKNFLKELIRLSQGHDSPIKAMKLLNEHGISLVIVPHFKKTYLDGAVFFMEKKPVIALSLRYDRLDYFWFTLLHEVAHLCLGHVEGSTVILDDLEEKDVTDKEAEANALARETCLPDAVWSKYPSLKRGEVATLHHVAGELEVNPAIVAGQIRHRKGDYRILSQHVGSKMVRKFFPEVFPMAAS